MLTCVANCVHEQSVNHFSLVKAGLNAMRSPTVEEMFQPSTISCTKVTGRCGLLSHMTPVFVLLLLEMWSDWRLSGTAGCGESHGGRQPSCSGWTRLQSPGGGEEESTLWYPFSTPVSNLAFYSVIPRPRPAFHHLYWKQWKAGQGLGTRLRFLLVQKMNVL